MVLRPPAIEAMREVSGFSTMPRTCSRRKSAAASFSAAVRRSSSSRVRAVAGSAVERMRISFPVAPKRRLSARSNPFFSREARKACQADWPFSCLEGVRRRSVMRCRPVSVVTAITRSGTTGSGSWASAQTVSVRIAGDIPTTARRTVSWEEDGADMFGENWVVDGREMGIILRRTPRDGSGRSA